MHTQLSALSVVEKPFGRFDRGNGACVMSTVTQCLVTEGLCTGPGMQRVTNWVTALMVETDMEPSHTNVPVTNW